MIIEAVLIILYTLLFILLIRKLNFFNLPGIGANAVCSVFILKIISGILLWAVYTYYYTDRSTADIFKYFDDSKIMHDAAFSKPLDYIKMLTGIENNNEYFNENYYNKMNNWFRTHESTLYNESHSLIRFNAVIRFFSFGYFNVHTVFMCFFSLTGLIGLYRFIYKYLRKNRDFLFLSVFLLPTVLFWGSGVLKEGLILTGMGLLLWSFDKVLNKSKHYFIIIIMILSFVLVRYTKFYIALSLIPLMIALLWSKYSKYKKVPAKFILITLLFVVSGYIISLLIPGMDVLAELSRKQRDFIGLANSVNSGSLIVVRTLEPNLWSLISNSPEALYNVLFRPWFFEITSPLLLAAALENLLLLFVALIAIFFYKKPDNRQKTLIYFSLIFVLEIFILSGLTTPVIGAFVRYKLPALPFLFIMLFAIIDFDKLITKMNFIKRFNLIKILSSKQLNTYTEYGKHKKNSFYNWRYKRNW